MDKSHYFSLMRETSQEVFPLIAKQIDSVREVDPELHQIMRYVVDRRNNELLLKPFLLRLAYELCGGADWRKTAPIGAAYELLNISSYQANSSFDNKHSVLTLPEKNSQFIASMVTRELSLECLALACNDFDSDVLDQIRSDLSICNKHIYIAQHYDLNVLTTKNLDRYSDENIFMRDYTARCFHGSGVFNGRCARAGALLACAEDGAIFALQRFGEEFGTGIQVMNDLADFVPPGADGLIGRGFQDQFSDIRNGRLTLGCYLFFTSTGTRGEEFFAHVINDPKLNESELREVAGLLMHFGVQDRVRKYAKGFAKKAKQNISYLPDVPQKALLSLMTCICHENKFIKALANYGRRCPA